MTPATGGPILRGRRVGFEVFRVRFLEQLFRPPGGLQHLGQPAALCGLRVARVAEDARIEAFVRDLGEGDFSRPVAYQNLAGEADEQPLEALLGHVFNHQTHHRGQVHDQLSQTKVAPPALDLIAFLRQSE
ncbi:MAG: DinB family protein [Alphaproteobacteria bacterium]|nr:DinB family protein [Alphaproteobacteria bacterium]